MVDFLTHLQEAATSTASLAAYAVVVAAWALRAWLKYQPQHQAKQILKMYKSDAERTRALVTLLGSAPPKALEGDQILKWVALQTTQRTRYLVVFAYLATLLTAIVVVGMALFRDSDVGKPPVLIKSKVERPTGTSGTNPR